MSRVWTHTAPSSQVDAVITNAIEQLEIRFPATQCVRLVKWRNYERLVLFATSRDEIRLVECRRREIKIGLCGDNVF